jgi:hypothetical protein
LIGSSSSGEIAISKDRNERTKMREWWKKMRADRPACSPILYNKVCEGKKRRTGQDKKETKQGRKEERKKGRKEERKRERGGYTG